MAGFRTIRITTRCKLETELGYLVCRSDNVSKILLDEILIVIIENQQVCITQALLSELIKRNIRVILCDKEHNPSSEIQPYRAAYNTYARINEQLAWSSEVKDQIWKKIITQKIYNQYAVLKMCHKDEQAVLLLKYIDEIEMGDTTNREGLAAKSYFAAIFGPSFERRSGGDIRNVYLDYGYSILLASVNRIISQAGFLMPLGVHHKGEENPFNLGCDIMEPFRPFIDRLIVENELSKENYKRRLIQEFDYLIKCGDKNMILGNAIQEYVYRVIAALNDGSIDKIPEVTFIHE